MKKEEIKQYPLRLREALKVRVDLFAQLNMRSTNAELNVLIEDGIKYRELQEKDHAK